MSWLEKLFCGKLIKELEDCEEECITIESYNNSLLGELDRNKNILNECKEEQKRLRDENSEMYQKWADALKDVAYYSKRLYTVEQLLAHSIVIPEFTVDESQLTIVKPRVHPLLSSYDLVTADLEYYGLPYNKWIELLGLIQPEVKKGLKSYHPSISDCDDYSYVTGAYVAVALRHAGLRKQGAFMVTWSNVHAYNAFVDTDDNTWIYEPQSGEVVGKLGETTDGYDTQLVWFPQKAIP